MNAPPPAQTAALDVTCGHVIRKTLEAIGAVCPPAKRVTRGGYGE